MSTVQGLRKIRLTVVQASLPRSISLFRDCYVTVSVDGLFRETSSIRGIRLKSSNPTTFELNVHQPSVVNIEIFQRLFRFFRARSASLLGEASLSVKDIFSGVRASDSTSFHDHLMTLRVPGSSGAGEIGSLVIRFQLIAVPSDTVQLSTSHEPPNDAEDRDILSIDPSADSISDRTQLSGQVSPASQLTDCDAVIKNVAFTGIFNVVGGDQYNQTNVFIGNNYFPGHDFRTGFTKTTANSKTSNRDEISTQISLQCITQREIELHDVVDDSGSVEVGTYKGNRVLVKRYTDPCKMMLDALQQQSKWKAQFLHLIGISQEMQPFYLVFSNPGTPMQPWVREQCAGNVQTALRTIVNQIKQISRAVKFVSGPQDGLCQLDIADVYIRPGSLPVLANFDPDRFHSKGMADLNTIWDAFLCMIAKSITGNPFQPNYVVGQHGPTGANATYLLRFLLHFLWDFRFVHSKRLQKGDDQKGCLITLFDQLVAVMERVEEEIKTAGDQDPNPLLSSLQKQFPSNLCAIWDVWEAIAAEPGDIGVFIGEDRKRPTFRKLANVAGQISSVLHVQREMKFWPDTSLWRVDTMPDGVTRHILRLSSCDEQSKYFGTSKGQEYAVLDKNWDLTATWSYLRNNRTYLAALAEEHKVDIRDLCLIFSWSKSPRYSGISVKSGNTLADRVAILEAVGFQDGVLYYFEKPESSLREGELHGYWPSSSSSTCQPLWPPSPDASGPVWAWQYSNDNLEVEISRKGPLGHFRYSTF